MKPYYLGELFMLTYLPVAKLAAQVVAGLGVSKIIVGIVKNNVTIVTTAEKVMVNAGSFVLSSMLVEQSSNHIEQVADVLVAKYAGRKNDDVIETEQ
jgi:hypothetical protein